MLVGLRTREVELHPKEVEKVIIFYGQQSARDLLVISIITYYLLLYFY